MSRSVSRSTLQHLQTLFSGGTAAGWTDGELLERFAGRRVESTPAEAGAAETAFAAVVDRHGPMVWGVCLRTLGNAHEAEDAFQATFLILARRAGTVRRDELGRWLHGVARKVALRARRQSARRQSMPGLPPSRTPADPSREAELGDLRAAVDEELGRLRAECRAAIDLCHLQGLTQDEAARRLDCSARTIKSRLSAGRRRLKARLARRGLAPAAAVAAAAATREACAAMPVALARSTVRAVMFSATGGAGAFPASVAALATGAMRAMFLSKLTLAAVLGLTATGAAVQAFQREGPAPAPSVPRPPVEDTSQDRQRAQNRQQSAGELPASYPQQSADENKPAARPDVADAAYAEIQTLTEEVHRLLVVGRRAEAQDKVRRLSASVQAWERSIRTVGAQGSPIVPDAARYYGDLYSTPPGAAPGTAYSSPNRINGSAAAPNTDQERRIRRLEELIENLLRERGGAPAAKAPPAQPGR